MLHFIRMALLSKLFIWIFDSKDDLRQGLVKTGLRGALLVATAFFYSSAFALPARVVLFRHAEEPAHGDELSAKGWERAKLLPELFKRPELKTSKVVALFGAAPKTDKKSIRSLQTLTYVSKEFNLPILATFEKDDFKALVAEILTNEKYSGKTVVICWQHKVLSKIAKRLGVENPPELDISDYDRYWIIDYAGRELTFRDLPQKLLPEDRDS